MEPNDPTPASESALAKLLNRLRAWSGGSQRRNRIIGAGFVGVAVVTVALWLTFAEIAVQPEDPSVARALEALDAGEDDAARAIIGELQKLENLTADDYGGAFFVLGALKAREAEKQWSPERSRADYYVASKYLGEAKSFGFPEGRDAEGLYLLGKSLIESRQLAEGIDILRQALEAGARGQSHAHLLLAEAYYYSPKPDYERTVQEIDEGVADPAIGAEERSAALLLRAEALSALERGDEAAAAVAEIGPDADPARRALVEGKAAVTQLEAALRQGGPVEPLAQRAEEALEKARHLDRLSTSISRESSYLKAKIAELVGAGSEALEGYAELRRNQGASPTGVAAALAEGRLLQAAGDEHEAIESYRRALDEIGELNAYRGALAPLSDIREQMRAAHQRFLVDGQYATALELAGRLGPLLGHAEKISLRAATLKRWGDSLIEAADQPGADAPELLHEGRLRLREAGVAYEQLAEARFATREFTDELWTAAETLLSGQAYEEAIRVLERYLRHEPVKRNALALLQIGDAHLARGEDDLAIRAYEECLEFHQTDASSYKARLNCAIAYRQLGDFETAEALLAHNLTRSSLSPTSPEWRDSKFELGRIFAKDGRHDDAIRELEEAVARYPDAEQSRSARYRIAEAHRHAAREPLERYEEANTVNERERAWAEASDHLEAALRMYEKVRNEITLENSGGELDRVTLRNCFALAGEVLFELERYEDAIQSFSSVSTLYQNEPYMLEALVHIYYCWRRLHDRPKALGVIQQARLLLDRLPPDSDFATSTNLSRAEWDRLLTQLASF